MFEKEWGPSGFFRGTGGVQAEVPGLDSPLRTSWTWRGIRGNPNLA